MDNYSGTILLNAVIFLLGVPWLIILFSPFLLLFSAPLATMMCWKRRTFLLSLMEKNKLSILVADDDEISVMPLVSALSHNNKGVNVKVVESGGQALEELSLKDYDLVFLDMLMPGKTGAETLQEGDQYLKVKKKLPVVFYTSFHKSLHQLTDSTMEKFKVLDVWAKDTPYGNLSQRVNQLLSQISDARAY